MARQRERSGGPSTVGQFVECPVVSGEQQSGSSGTPMEAWVLAARLVVARPLPGLSDLRVALARLTSPRRFATINGRGLPSLPFPSTPSLSLSLLFCTVRREEETRRCMLLHSVSQSDTIRASASFIPGGFSAKMMRSEFLRRNFYSFTLVGELVSPLPFYSN